jgi:hypothetical protein
LPNASPTVGVGPRVRICDPPAITSLEPTAALPGVVTDDLLPSAFGDREG